MWRTDGSKIGPRLKLMVFRSSPRTCIAQYLVPAIEYIKQTSLLYWFVLVEVSTLKILPGQKETPDTLSQAALLAVKEYQLY